MNLLRSIYGELVSLFVDDGSLALLSLLLVAIAACLVKLLGLAPLWAGLLLVVGCPAILAESALRAGRRTRPRKS